MSYEKLGMGWSDMPVTTGWLFKETTFPSCGDVENGIKKCFTDTRADLRCAEYSGCRNIRGELCETVSGTPGAAWCCPPDRPPPPHVALCVPEGTRPGAVAQEMTCRFHHVPFSSLFDARSRSVWTVQNKLCQLGIDPGPVDGTENSSHYRPAIRAFQTQRGLPVTGQPDVVTLSAMGLTNSQSLADAISGSSLLPGGGAGTTNLLPIMMIGAFGLSGVFLFYAVKKYKRSKR